MPSLLDGRGHLFPPARVPDLLAKARLDEVELEFRAQIDAVVDAGLTPTHLDWHCLADGGRDLTGALAGEYGLAVRVWLEPARSTLRGRGLPVVDHEFLDSFSLSSRRGLSSSTTEPSTGVVGASPLMTLPTG